MGRILTALATLAIVSAPGLVAAATAVAPDTATSAVAAVVQAASSTATATSSTTATKTVSTPSSSNVSPATVTATTATTTTSTAATTGNGGPSGAHYNLNIIGVPKDKTADMTNNDGHRIFVQLNGGEDATSLNGKNFSTLSKVNKIFLQPAPAGGTFQFLDANATDTTGALFQLPADVSTTWTVWARALGKPGGKSLTTTCATVNVTDPVTGLTTQEVLCSMATLTMQRTKNAKFQNVSSTLLFLTITVDPTANAALATCLGVTTTTTLQVSLFNGCLQNFFWNYDNMGLKLLQLRLYPA